MSVGIIIYPILYSLFGSFEILLLDKNMGPIHPFRPHFGEQGRNSCDSSQMGLNRKAIGPKFPSLSKEREIGL
jgi:hypothetical protein